MILMLKRESLFPHARVTPIASWFHDENRPHFTNFKCRIQAEYGGTRHVPGDKDFTRAVWVMMDFAGTFCQIQDHMRAKSYVETR